MKVHKRLRTAVKYGKGLPIIELSCNGERLYISGFGIDEIDSMLTQIHLITSDGRKYASRVTLSHLNRLGNANHAHAKPGYEMENAFPERH